MNLVVGHNHSKTKLNYPKKLKLKDLGVFIGFKLNEVPKKYYKEYDRPKFTLKGWSFYPPIDIEDFKK